MSDEQVWEEVAGILRGYVASILGPLAFARYSPLRDERYIREDAARAEAEERDRREWLDGVKRRLGLVTAADIAEAGGADETRRVAFCAPGNEMLVAIALRMEGVDIAEIRAHPWLTGDDVYLAGPPVLPPVKDLG